MTTDITELAQSLKAAAENAIGAHERLAAYPYGEIIDISQHEGEQIDIDITDINEFHEEASPANILALVEALEKAQQRIEVLLATMEVEPVENHIGSKNALDAIVSFIKSKSNPTVKCYEEVSEQLFKDNCHGIHSHVIEYILKLGEELEDLRAEQAETQPAPVVPDAATAIRACMSEFPESARDIVEECADIAENACRAAMLNGGKS